MTSQLGVNSNPPKDPTPTDTIDSKIKQIITDLLIRKGVDTRPRAIDLNDEGAAISEILQHINEEKLKARIDELYRVIGQPGAHSEQEIRYFEDRIAELKNNLKGSK
jgi:hypothetical protein